MVKSKSSEETGTPVSSPSASGSQTTSQTETTLSTPSQSDTPKSSSTKEEQESPSKKSESEAPDGISTRSSDESRPKTGAGITELEWRSLPEPALRLFLIEKGRKEGVSACNRAHREESHGDTHYLVDQSQGKIRLVTTHGRGKKAEADLTKLRSQERLAAVRRELDGIDAGIANNPQNAELLGQLGEVRKAKTLEIAMLEAKIRACDEVPAMTQKEEFF